MGTRHQFNHSGSRVDGTGPPRCLLYRGPDNPGKASNKLQLVKDAWDAWELGPRHLQGTCIPLKSLKDVDASPETDNPSTHGMHESTGALSGVFGIHVEVRNPTANVSMMYPIYSCLVASLGNSACSASCNSTQCLTPRRVSWVETRRSKL